MKYILLFIVVLFCIPSALALTNPGFETGDFTGWSFTNGASVGTTYANDGVYGCRITPAGTWPSISQLAVLGDTLSFDLKIVGSAPISVKVVWQGVSPIGNFDIITYTSSSGWNRKYVDTSAWQGYSGNLYFQVKTSNTEMWLDDISLTEQESTGLTGYILNTHTGNPITVATISLNDSASSETTSNDTGYYSISGIVPDTYLMAVTKIGYNDYTAVIDVSSNLEKNVSLSYATPVLTSLSILDSGDNSLLLGWKESLGADGVHVYVDSQTNLVATVETPYTSVKMYDLTDLEPGTSYNIWCKPYKDPMQGSMYYVSGTTTGGGGGGGGGEAIEVLPPYEDIQPEIPEYPETYNLTNITSSDLITLAATNPEIIYEALSNITIKSPLPDKPGDNLLYFYLLIISVCSTLYSSKKEGWEVVTIISFVAVVISLIKLGWI